MTGCKAEDQARDLSGMKHNATHNNVTIETITISVQDMHKITSFF
jgi:hypothetical protein